MSLDKMEGMDTALRWRANCERATDAFDEDSFLDWASGVSLRMSFFPLLTRFHYTLHSAYMGILSFSCMDHRAQTLLSAW